MFALEEYFPKRFTDRASQFFLKMCPPALYCCVCLCLAILYITFVSQLWAAVAACLAILCLPALDVASSSFDFEKHKLFGVYGGVISFMLTGLVDGNEAAVPREVPRGVAAQAMDPPTGFGMPPRNCQALVLSSDAPVTSSDPPK